MSKLLNELMATEVMGWKFLEYVNGYSIFQTPERRIARQSWNPAECLDDALLCLERAKDIAHGWWVLEQLNGIYYCRILDVNDETIVDGNMHTPALAMCVCALKAVGVPESLITQAME